MATKQKLVKKKKKVWIQIEAPELFSNVSLGETLVSDKESVINKSLTLNQGTFTNDIKKQNLLVKFKVDSLVDNKAKTKVSGLELTGSYIKRLVRRGKSKIEDSFIIVTQDGKKARIKPVLITNMLANKSILSKIRNNTKDKITELAKTKSFEDLFSLIVRGNVQKDLKSELSKVYPLRYVDIKKFNLIK